MRKENNINTFLGLVLSTEEVSKSLQGVTKGPRKTPFNPKHPPLQVLSTFLTTDAPQGGNAKALT